MMVGNGDESALFGNSCKLLGNQFVGGANLLKNLFGIVGTFIIRNLRLYGIDLIQIQQAVNAARYEAAETPFEFQGFLQVGFRYYLRLFFHIKMVNL